MNQHDGLSPHHLVEFLAAISRCEDSEAAARTAAELVAEEFDAEVGAVVIGGELVSAVGFGRQDPPRRTLLAVEPGTGVVDVDDVGTCQTVAAVWKAGTVGRLVVARTGLEFTVEDRNLLLGMASGFGLSLDMITVLERQRDQQRVLEVLLDIQRAISHRAPLSVILSAVTDGAGTVLHGCPVSLVLDDARDPERPIIAGADLRGVAATVSVPVHIHGVPAGALIAAPRAGAPLSGAERSLLQSFAEHASLALADARTLEKMEGAFRDPLTGLPNRQLFLDRLGQALTQADDRRLGPCVLFIDLDRFKAVNDTLGHSAGDVLLKAVTGRVTGCIGTEATAARFGGDEFAVLMPQLTSVGQATTVAEEIIAALHRPFSIRGEIIHIGATVGIAHSGTRAKTTTADELLANADVAMYRAKASGGGTAMTYNPQMRAALLDRLELQAHLQSALARGELSLHYQPIVDLPADRTIGVEALLRWNHPRRGPVPPSDFIPLAEVTGTIVPIGRWVLDEACRQVSRWRRRHPDLTMNVNVSVRQLQDRDFVADVHAALTRERLPGEALILEITESVLLEEAERTRTILGALKRLGITVALDDFGTGYSSLGYLQRFPVDILKIDRSFVSGAASESGDDQLVRTVIELGKAYDLDVVAEGIENDAQRTRLVDLGCRHGQGYLFSRPVDAAGMDALLAAGQARVPTAHGPADVPVFADDAPAGDGGPDGDPDDDVGSDTASASDPTVVQERVSPR
ncbi:putative bifunctional diguanylate cyclase/phosphodiesterase [Cellulomonas bogoriensis]|uniref:Signal peptide protein n=1 Tax=Cellulomonas bogoriensis 69B4 = DSM 16987 TaxID=1386082 RepID=A0A0A0BZB0_9CELL|nr:EAL domain-containing protein [Cellulomonas bogoriensis]KGM13231.1 signal peptide protein [Cellulomonas bogoriensis 69B4 = DSM 16987]